MTVLTMDWNSSSVYSRVGNGASFMFEGLKRVQGIFREEFVTDGSEGEFTSSLPELVNDC